MTAILAMLALSAFAPDAYWICGPEPKTECLEWVTTCLEDGLREGYSQDESAEYCAENVDPYLIPWMMPAGGE